MIDEYKAAGVSPKDVWPQSFNLNDVLYWINKEPAFGKQAVYLDDAEVPTDLPSAADLLSYRAQGVNIVAPPNLGANISARKPDCAIQVHRERQSGRSGYHYLDSERSGLLTDGGGFYYQTVSSVINKPGDTMEVLDVLARQVGILGIFSDWPGTVTYYANCMGLE